MDKVDKVLHRVLTILFNNISQFKSVRLSCEVGYRDERGQNDINFIFFKLQYICISYIYIDIFLTSKIICTILVPHSSL